MIDWVWIPVPLLTSSPFSVATKTPLPETNDEITAIYVPFPLSVTGAILPMPDNFVIVTIEPPVIMLLPLASFAVTVNVWVLTPLALILAMVGVKVDAVASTGPAGPEVYVMIDWVWIPVPLLTSSAFSVATKTPLPADTGEVTFAVYVPSP